jgi:hypothetical protein
VKSVTNVPCDYRVCNMNAILSKAGAGLLLLTVCFAALAQVCNDNIPATTPDSRFRDNGDGTVTDTGTRLMWKRCAEGQNGSACESGSPYMVLWGDALWVASEADFAGYTDWRVPNKNELESLVERRCYDPAINATYFPRTPRTRFWTSSPAVSNGVFEYGDDPFSVSFWTGSVSPCEGCLYEHVRLVRDIP